MTEPQTPPEEKAATTSLGDLIGEVTKDLSTLMRQELELAKAELTQSAKRAGKGAGMMGAAGYAGLMAVFFLSVALWWALGDLIGHGWSAVVVAALWAIIGTVLFVVGRKKIESVKGAPHTVDTLKQIPDTLKRNGENQ